jgi:hypothetical protein
VKAVRIRVLIKLGAAFAIGALCLLAFTPARGNASASTFRTAATSVAQDTGASCPPEANSCAPVMTLPCAAGSCTVTAGPVSQLGQGQAVYVSINGLESGEQVALGMCALASGTTPVSDPQCASYLPPPPSCTSDCNPTSSPLEWQYAVGAGGDASTVLSIGTEFDPNIQDATPIVSQNVAGYVAGQFGSFFCDNGPTNPCGIEVIDLGPTTSQGYVVGDGYPPAGQGGAFEHAGGSTTANTVIVPLNWASTGNGCQSAPIMQVDASYSVSQFLPAAGGATCTGPDGVAVLPTSLPSVDDSTCQSTGVTHCPITDVINGNAPATFTDDPNDPATLAELQQAGGKFAYIPIAVSSTEIAFEGQTGRTGVGAITYPLSSYNLTPAQTAGIMTQLWTSPIAQLFLPQDDLCSQPMGTAPPCTETRDVIPVTPTVYSVNGQYANIIVNGESGGTPVQMPFNFIQYDAPGATNPYYETSTKDLEKNYAGDTGYALLNPWPGDSGPQPTTENVLDAMFPSTGSGASYETTGWVCNAPESQFSVNLPFGGTALLTDLESGQQILANAEDDPIEMTQVSGVWTEANTVTQQIDSDPKGCQAVSTLPTNFASTTAGGGSISPYSPSSQPLTAAHTIQGVISKGTLGFAFSAMDSSEADFFGLLPANLQNAAGTFVAPSAASITAALNDATPAPNGTLIPNFNNATDPAAYPMPMVTYALISTSPQPSTDQADQLTEMLTNLVNYSHTGGAGSSEPLPPGYVPLPDNLATQALSEISKDVIAPNGQPVGSESAAAASLAANSSSHPGAATSSNSSNGGPFSFSSALGAPFGVNGLAKTSGGSAAKAGSNSSGSGGSTENPIGRFIAVTLGDNRYLVPGLLLLALLCLVAGPLLYMSPSLRKPATAADGGGEGADDEGESPPPVE